MPELPEVEVVRAGLEPAVSGARVLHVDVVDDRALTRHDGPAEDFADRLTGRTIAAAVRRGKFLWMPLQPERDGDRPEALVAHLGMSGQILLGRGRPAAKHRRILIDVQPAGTDRSGAAEPPVELEFVDQRTFGSMAIDPMVPTIDGAPAGFGGQVDAIDPGAVWRRWVPGQVSHIARDPLDPAFDDDRFTAMARKRSSGIKRVLLDQGVVSGIGNIYADESLWAAKLHYDRAADRLTRADLRRLLDEVRAILRRALEDGGTSFDAQYVNVNGQSGYFSQRLNVYGQQGKPCPRCGTTIVREAFMNRSSHICPVCQPRPRARTR
ncbi:bifunctional DNA-formamidopyrimidine glycosylase/DNA-(apurinic or apyrimidinic site) lyase [Curtobacterium flaccumfaciens]|uniref:bifunctional DNA-formamidopyrimidine glycosylase/DNA-(apurinic or apyrimidinic site) lyase n=1 Tax=Curtobacterium flaccumfaciens TaxID=2035 RepID=UPI001266BBE0|nr:bifunctional DNA-formamidopyrimidine glycosylase/DNA-(apurinic or apyrimidinic site) lyase [Curtobacterium flaccumfaciens]MBT1666008.1 bifunctional DNA-formamidopyrimidine glycosylase/DNA-(apurinic or apyrimidinic site) lyase [Curtobacterium flaccumfaciens pv. flaccumfaciens]QFS80142.1 bifunctional DNA-formamidopyrimidine glycosylase/DNA-(apurinic or apyrimidinic site) lyase [Curtobacterium flaccumfaciens pv. flaccumfaciens]